MLPRVLAVSVALNLFFAGILVWWKQPMPPQTARTLSVTRRITNSVATLLVPSLKPAVKSSFHWNAIASTNLEVLVLNLREVGCPERTIQTIIAGQLDTLYAQRLSALPVETNFWMDGAQRYRERRRRREYGIWLQQEKWERCRELLGIEWETIDRGLRLDDELDFAPEYLEFLGSERARQLAHLLMGFDDLKDELRPEQGIETLAERERRRTVAQAALGKVERLLAPAEMEELNLRALTFKVLDVFSIERQFGSEMTGAEFREFLRITQESEPFLMKLLFDLPEPDGTPDEAVRDRQEQQIRALLGEERFWKYLQAQDPRYGFLADEKNPLSLSSGTGLALRDLKRQSLEAAGAVRAQSDLDAESRQLALAAIQSETERSVRALLSSDQYVKYRSSSGAWIEQLNPPNASAP